MATTKSKSKVFPAELIVGYESLIGGDAYAVILQPDDIRALPDQSRIGRYQLVGVEEVEQTWALKPVRDTHRKAAR